MAINIVSRLVTEVLPFCEILKSSINICFVFLTSYPPKSSFLIPHLSSASGITAPCWCIPPFLSTSHSWWAKWWHWHGGFTGRLHVMSSDWSSECMSICISETRSAFVHPRHVRTPLTSTHIIWWWQLRRDSFFPLSLFPPSPLLGGWLHIMYVMIQNPSILDGEAPSPCSVCRWRWQAAVDLTVIDVSQTTDRTHRLRIDQSAVSQPTTFSIIKARWQRWPLISGMLANQIWGLLLINLFVFKYSD